MLLEALYNGELYPSETVTPTSPAYKAARQEIEALMTNFESTLSKDDYTKVIALYDAISRAESIETMEQFKFGVAVGALLMKEIDEIPYFRKK